jgi:hypothetical protein
MDDCLDSSKSCKEIIYIVIGIKIFKGKLGGYFFCKSILDLISLNSPAIIVTPKTASNKLNMV